MELYIREYRSGDCEEMADLFYHTVHTVNAAHYTNEQLAVWADGNVDMAAWDRSFLNHMTFVAIKDGIIVGFGDIDGTGYLDRLYVHKDYQKMGIAAALCDKLEEASDFKKITTHASITAKTFFEKRGYCIIKKQQVMRKGILLENYVMCKTEGDD